MTTPLHPVGDCERYEPVVGAGGEVVCFSCGGRLSSLAEKVKETAGKSDILTPELKKFAEWQIGMLEKVILQSKRMIHEIRQKYNLPE